MIEYPYSVFTGFLRAASNERRGMYKTLLNVVRVAASDSDERCKAVWKELNRGG